MTATGQNVTIYKGDSARLQVTVLEQDTEEILNITGWEFTWVLYAQGTGEIKLTKTVGSGIALSDPTNGILEITLAPADTESFFGYYNHELESVDDNSDVATLFTGYFRIYDSKT